MGLSDPQPFHSLKKSLTTGNDTCPPWQVKNTTSNKCMCDAENIDYIVSCSDNPYQLMLHECYCMTTNQHQQLLVGSCYYTCHRIASGYFINIILNSTSDINKFICGKYHRQGLMCGSCEADYAPPVYSYSLSCTNCTTSNWAKYITVSLLPVTAFFIIVITFRLSATSPKLNAFILFNQILTSPSNMRSLEVVLPKRSKYAPSQQHIIKTFVSVFSVWNLDFFRLVYPSFCLHPDTNNLQVLAVDYIIAVYPLLLVALSYLLVILYDHNVGFIVYPLKPFVTLFIRFRRQWNIKSSLVDGFATFFLLSYVKILSVSVDLLLPVVLYDQHGQALPQLYVYNQGDVTFLGRHHLPYACLAIFFFITFTLTPMLLLFLYPCSCFQRFLNHTGCSRYHSLHIFMDTFQGHYKDGTEGTRDFRFFSGLYLLLRAVVYISTVLAYQVSSYAYTTIFLTVFTVFLALSQPFKKYLYNVTEAIILVVIAMLYVTLFPFMFYHSHTTEVGVTPAVYLLIIVPYIIILFLLWSKPCKMLLKCCRKLCEMFERKEQFLISINHDDYENLNNS